MSDAPAETGTTALRQPPRADRAKLFDVAVDVVLHRVDVLDLKIDIVAGKKGYGRVEDESEKILRLLKENDGYLPFNDKSDPEEIYLFFGMSTKTFKMTTGNLYKQRKISFEQTGIKLIED